jgi:hypothetical protein
MASEMNTVSNILLKEETSVKVEDSKISSGESNAQKPTYLNNDPGEL